MAKGRVGSTKNSTRNQPKPDDRVRISRAELAHMAGMAAKVPLLEGDLEGVRSLAREREAHIRELNRTIRDLEHPQRHPLELPFMDALAQAKTGKGSARHALGLPFMEQPWVMHARQHGIGFLTGQAAKKIGEAGKLTGDEYDRELLGALVYTAMAIIYRRGIASSALAETG